MRSKLKALIKITAISTALFSAGSLLSVINKPSTQVSAKKRHTARHYKPATEYWSRRIRRVAHQRRKYHFPEIEVNTRDIGGYKTPTGRYEIKPGKIYRSGAMLNLTRKGARQLKRLGINTVIDLRYLKGPKGINKYPQPGEFGYAKTKYGIHIHYINLPSNTWPQERSNSESVKRIGEKLRYGAPFTGYHQARRTYHKLVLDVLHHKHGAIMVNCLKGRDRTGIASAILEYGLGIPHNEQMDDFMLTDYYSHNAPYLENVGRINNFYGYIRHHYGSMKKYWTKGLHLTQRTRDRLQDKYLEPTRKYRKEKHTNEIIQEIVQQQSKNKKHRAKSTKQKPVNTSARKKPQTMKLTTKNVKPNNTKQNNNQNRQPKIVKKPETQQQKINQLLRIGNQYLW